MGKAWSKPKRMCYHPELIPTAWNQPKPEPAEMVYFCKCGENYGCPVCGWGSATWPCSCMREWQAKQKKDNLRVWYDDTSDRYAGAWEALADA